MKVVFVTTESFIDHSYTIISELKNRIDLQVFILAKRKTEEIERWCTSLQAKFVERKRYRNPLSFYSELKFINELSKLKADKIWFNALNLFQSIICKFLIKNLLVTVHDVEYHPESKDYFSILSLKLTFAFHKNKICTVSKTQADIFYKIYGFKPKVLQLPIIDYYSKITLKEKESFYKSGHKANFFFFGSILPYKGIEVLIKADEILLERKVDFSLNIYGKIKYNVNYIKSKILELPNAKLFNEYIDYKDVQKIFLINDILILPYRQVTQCGPLLIAYSLNIPSICSDLPGFREYVYNGKSGFLFNNTPEDLADKIQHLIGNPQIINEMKTYINSEITKKFSMQYLVNNYIDIISH